MTSHIVVQNRFGGVRSAQRSVVHWRDHLRHAWADGIGACGRDRGDDLSFGEAARKGGSRLVLHPLLRVCRESQS